MKKLINLLEILYEDKYILVVYKPPGLVVHVHSSSYEQRKGC
jgi:23S rRNA-/tRNA-specific pseudouridylate synthase